MAGRKKPSKFPKFITRNSSIRGEGGRKSKPTTPIRTHAPDFDAAPDNDPAQGGMRTAPLRSGKDSLFGDMIASAPRNRSADRRTDRYPSPHSNGRDNSQEPGDRSRDHSKGPTVPTQAPRNENIGTSRFAALKNVGNKFNNVSHSFKEKIGKNITGDAKAPVEEPPHQIRVLNLPLVEQTRITRIAKRLEDSKDKTEFWMPALPWRCIE